MQTTSNRTERGFHVIELLVVLLVIGVLGFGGYTVWHRNHKQAPVASTSVTAPQIKTAKDLDKAASTVDQLDTTTNSSDLDTLEQELNSL